MTLAEMKARIDELLAEDPGLANVEVANQVFNKIPDKRVRGGYRRETTYCVPRSISRGRLGFRSNDQITHEYVTISAYPKTYSEMAQPKEEK